MSSLGINKVILVGHLGKDPDIRVMQNGKEMASFSLATSEAWVDKASGSRTEKTEWHNVVVFSEGLVKIIKSSARKGSKVYLEGSIRTRKWVDQNNSDRYTTEIVLQNFNSALCLLDSRGGAPVNADQSYEDVDTATDSRGSRFPDDNAGGSSDNAMSFIMDDEGSTDEDIDEIPF
ncbi:single-stranded DNA-binding protein [Anaplasma bovis]|uniref:single-stranded DNA-binding protein n=1 Tax=Anaplasma bovis TaxID=186733 RepID=UPI002FF36B9A